MFAMSKSRFVTNDTTEEFSDTIFDEADKTEICYA